MYDQEMDMPSNSTPMICQSPTPNYEEMSLFVASKPSADAIGPNEMCDTRERRFQGH